MDQAELINAYNAANGGAFNLEMMKRTLEQQQQQQQAGPDAKKARWSPTNGQQQQQQDAFANYGYGQPGGMAAPSPGGFGASPGGYGAPSLSLNTNLGGMAPGAGISPTIQSGMPASALQQQQAAQLAQANMFASYNMLGMGMMYPGFNAASLMSPSQSFDPQRLPTLNIPAASNYTAGALGAALAATSANATNRTVYVGNLPPTASVDELLNLVHFGPLESVRVLPEKSCVFLSFLDGATAAAFHADATIKKLGLHNQELKIGWGKPSPVPQQVLLAIGQSNASRNVYLGGLEESMTEEQLRDDLSRFGLIDQVKIVRDKNIGFVHFLSITTATKVVNTLPTEPAWAGKRVNYGKDRCAYIPKGQQPAAQSAQVAAAQSLMAQSAISPTSANPFTSPFSPFTPFTPESSLSAGAQGLNRTVYLGNIHPETTTEELCNAIRGGVLQSIRYMEDKHIAFVTFIDPAAAFTFFQVASYQGLTLNNRRLKIGWGKNSGPLPPSLALSVHSGATRNVYIGNIEDFVNFNEEKLKRDFGEYGEIELVNFLKEKNCAFVNYTNIANAIKAIDGIKAKPDYAGLRIAHGKDRCANPPRQGPQGGTSAGGSRRGNMSAVSPTTGISPSMASQLPSGLEPSGGLPDVTVPPAGDDGDTTPVEPKSAQPPSSAGIKEESVDA